MRRDFFLFLNITYSIGYILLVGFTERLGQAVIVLETLAVALASFFCIAKPRSPHYGFFFPP